MILQNLEASGTTTPRSKRSGAGKKIIGAPIFNDDKKVLKVEDLEYARDIKRTVAYLTKAWNDYLKSIKFSPAAKESNAVNT